MAEQKENRFSGMTPEEIRLEAKRQIVRSAFLALAALIVIGVACYAWFVSSKSVTAIVGTVSMGDVTFELASAGQLSAFDTPDGYAVPTGEEYDAEPDKKWWTFGNQTIQWRMTGTANLGNYRDNETTEPEGIRPGTSGQLTFYVIPRGDGPLQVQFDLSIVPLKAKKKDDPNSSLSEIQGESAAVNLLRGHLLFAYPQKYKNGTLAADPDMTLANYADGSFTIDFGTVKKDTPIPVTLEWHWYNTLSDALNSDYGDAIFTNMKNAPKDFFYNEGNEVTISEGATKDTIWADSALNNCFNNADYHIGQKIDAMILRLNTRK